MATAANIQKNVPYLKQQFTAALGNSSVVVKFLCVAIVIGYFLSFSEGAMQALTVIPGNVLPPNFWAWTYLTHSFIETHIWNVVIDICIIILYGKLLEPLWGAMEMLIFYLVVTLTVAMSTSVVYLFIYQLTINPDYLFATNISGLAGYAAGFSVAVKQIMPDHVLVNSPFGKLRNKHIPMWLLVCAIVIRLIGIVDGPYPIMFGMGLLASWIYLRFYQKHSNGNRGDMAESFTFASFFPDALQPVLTIVSTAIFSLLVRIRVCKKPQRKYDFSAPTTITVSLPGTDPLDAERRRQLALKALNERLSKVQKQVEWPALDEADTTPLTDDTASEKDSTRDDSLSEQSAPQASSSPIEQVEQQT